MEKKSILSIKSHNIFSIYFIYNKMNIFEFFHIDFQNFHQQNMKYIPNIIY